MSGSLKLSLQVTIADPASISSAQVLTVTDLVASVHDYVDGTPQNVATSGAAGAAFLKLPTSVVQIERIVADITPGSDLVLRVDGRVASVLGANAAPAIVGGETLVLAIDQGGQITVTFVAGDTTIAKVAARINFALGLQVASVDLSTGFLRLSGFLTGGSDAKTAGWQAGSVQLVSGTALALLGLTAGTTWGSGRDQRLGAGPFCKSFPTSGLPRLIELSGTSNGARFWVAGKAS